MTLRALAEVDPEQARAIVDRSSEGVRRDRDFVRSFWAANRSSVTEIARRTNDFYLKAQGQEAGVRSYGRMVDLLIAEDRLERSD